MTKAIQREILIETSWIFTPSLFLYKQEIIQYNFQCYMLSMFVNHVSFWVNYKYVLLSLWLKIKWRKGKKKKVVCLIIFFWCNVDFIKQKMHVLKIVKKVKKIVSFWMFVCRTRFNLKTVIFKLKIVFKALYSLYE